MNNNVIKRVISNPDQSVERDFKMSKTSMHNSEAAGGDTHPHSPAKHSKVDNDKNTDNRSSPVNEDLRTKLNDGLVISSHQDDGLEKEGHGDSENSPDLTKDNEIAQVDIPRQVSVDGSTSQVKVPASTSSDRDTTRLAVAEVAASRTIGSVKASGGGGEIMPKRHSGISDRSSGGSLMTKDQWGWFEDVHEGETDGDDKEDLDDENRNNSDGISSQSRHGTEKKNKLLFHDVDRVEEVVPIKGKILILLLIGLDFVAVYFKWIVVSHWRVFIHSCLLYLFLSNEQSNKREP